MVKIIQAWLQQYVNHELPDVQAVLEKAEEPEIKLSTFVGSQRKQGNSRKTSNKKYRGFIEYTKAFVWITTNCGTSLKRWEYQTTLPVS